jgi:RNA polymerase sigma-70 factor (ECF subfamily)
METNTIKDLYQRYAHLIYGRCLRILGSEDDAWDGVQIVFMKLIEAIDTIRDRERIVPWIFSAATNHCFNVLRSKKKFVSGADPDDMGREDRFDDRIADRQLINALLATQDRRVQEAVYYTHVEGLDQKEIQRIAGQSPATIRRNLHRFKQHCEDMKLRFDFL